MSLVTNHLYGHNPKYDAQTPYVARRPVGDVGDAYRDPTGSDGHLDISANFEFYQIPRPWDNKWRRKLLKALSHLWYRGDLGQRQRNDASPFDLVLCL